jgi:tRNA threonylcarbamoyladenosine biosynthesis protein TsaB
MLLAFETSAKAASVALFDGEKLLGESYQNTGLTHSQTLMLMAEDLLKNCGTAVSDLTAVAVAAGPGSFTGVRIGVSAAKGLAWGKELPCYGVSTLEAMALGLGVQDGYILPTMDARRNQVYNAIFEIVDGKPRRLTEDRPIALSDLAQELRQLDGPVFLVGDGSFITEKYLKEVGIACCTAPDNLLWQSAWGVAMAAQDKPMGNSDSLLPVYLRLSQAERERQERLNKENSKV